MAKPPMSIYELSRAWFDFCFANPDIIHPNHTAIFFFAIEHCNRLGWKEKFGFPSTVAMEAIGIKKHQTFTPYFRNICEWGFFKLVKKSSNQYSANVISLQVAEPKNGKALDKALIGHGAKQPAGEGQSTGQSKHTGEGSIDIQYTSIQDNHTTNSQSTSPRKKFDLIFPFESEEFLGLWDLWVNYRAEAKKPYHTFTNQQAALEKLNTLAGGNEKIAITIIKDCIANNAFNFFNDGKQGNTNSKNTGSTNVANDALSLYREMRGLNNGGGD